MGMDSVECVEKCRGDFNHGLHGWDRVLTPRLIKKLRFTPPLASRGTDMEIGLEDLGLSE
jgi:hypothetical protein